LLKAAIQALAVITAKYISLNQNQINSDSMTKLLDEVEEIIVAMSVRSDARVISGTKKLMV